MQRTFLRRCLWCITVVSTGLVLSSPLFGQSFRRGGAQFEAVRPVALAADARNARVVVVEFWHHGMISPKGDNVVVAAGSDFVPTRILQLGPGDFCRLAFQTNGSASYEVLYGGDPIPEDALPAWTAAVGLLLETREYRDCNLNSLESVRQAFEQAVPIGADFVDGVAHAGNIFEYRPGGYFSRYSGTLYIDSAGTYGFLTTSQDASFLLIDGKQVVAAPGRHRPERWAKPGMRKDIRLSAGAHAFEYYHVATTQEGMAVAAWEVNPKAPKPAPVAIPREAFRAHLVARGTVGRPVLAKQSLVPDFRVKILCDVPLPDNPTPLVGVQFYDNSPTALLAGGKVTWDFGDGQTSSELTPMHVYLKPGLYTVREAIRRAGRDFEVVNRVYVYPPRLTKKDKLYTLDDFLPVLETYDSAELDLLSLRQLVEAYLFKADQYLPPPKPNVGDPTVDPEATLPQAETPEQRAEREANRDRYLNAAIQAALPVFSADAAAAGDQALWELAELTAPLAREHFGDAQTAGRIYYGAAQRIEVNELKAAALTAAADVALNDMGNKELGKNLVATAVPLISDDTRDRALLARLYRVRGDLAAALGNGDEARKAYQKAEAIRTAERSHIERTAWEGAYSRSVEDFLREREWERAIHEIHRWKEDFPGDMIEGYLPLLEGRYWAAQGKHELVIALADRLLVVNPYSPYIEELLFLAARSEIAMGRVDRCIATLESLLKDYPGSPLVPEVREYLEKVKTGEITPPKAPVGRPRQ